MNDPYTMDHRKALCRLTGHKPASIRCSGQRWCVRCGAFLDEDSKPWKCADCGQPTHHVVYLYEPERRSARRPFCWKCAIVRGRLARQMGDAMARGTEREILAYRKILSGGKSVATTLRDPNCAWPVDCWAGAELRVGGKKMTITSNDSYTATGIWHVPWWKRLWRKVWR